MLRIIKKAFEAATLTVAVSGVFMTLLPQQAIAKEEKGLDNDLPRLPRSSLLIGWPPFLLELVDADLVVKLQPEDGQTRTQDATSVYPSIAQDGKTVAYARLKAGQPGRILAISVYSLTTNQHTEYATGEFSGSTAISPDASRLAYPDARTKGSAELGPGSYHLHIIDLKTGKQILGPEISSSPWPIFASWSPDSRRLAFSDSGEIRVWDSETDKVWKVADGDLPSWSPSGEWIAYLPWTPDPRMGWISSGRWPPECLLVHPDGTGRKILVDWTRPRNYRTFVEPPVWSPDSGTLLLNELDDVDKNTVTVHAVNVETLKVETPFRHSYHILAWVHGD